MECFWWTGTTFAKIDRPKVLGWNFFFLLNCSKIDLKYLLFHFTKNEIIIIFPSHTVFRYNDKENVSSKSYERKF